MHPTLSDDGHPRIIAIARNCQFRSCQVGSMLWMRVVKRSPDRWNRFVLKRLRWHGKVMVPNPSPSRGIVPFYPIPWSPGTCMGYRSSVQNPVTLGSKKPPRYWRDTVLDWVENERNSEVLFVNRCIFLGSISGNSVYPMSTLVNQICRFIGESLSTKNLWFWMAKKMGFLGAFLTRFERRFLTGFRAKWARYHLGNAHEYSIRRCFIALIGRSGSSLEGVSFDNSGFERWSKRCFFHFFGPPPGV